VYESPNTNKYSVAFQGLADAMGTERRLVAKARRPWCNMLGKLSQKLYDLRLHESWLFITGTDIVRGSSGSLAMVHLNGIAA
jgi:hypothetical protein